jgi:TolB-like protein/tetratricopeptide (TPR) repeat protein
MEGAAPNRAERRLAAILAADVAGWSRLMGADEEGTLERLKALRRELLDPTITAHKGRIVKTTGDGMLVEFQSVVDAVRCAVAVQQAMAARNAELPEDRRLEFRVGINLGDVIAEEGDIYGDGVNIAARLEALAEPGGICISRSVLTQTRGKLDFPVQDLGEQTLKNIAQPVHVFRVPAEPKPMPEATLPPPEKPSIAVLPFQNLSGDSEQEYFADGMVEEIITALSRIRWLFVIARNSSFTYKGQAIDVKRVGRELGVRYVLEGSVRKAGNRVRITGQLIDAETGAHLWADRFDGSLEDVFDLQDQVAVGVAGVIEPTLQAAESRRAANRPTTDLGAYDLYLRALPVLFRLRKEDIIEAASLLDRAIERDPRYGAALAFASICHMRLASDGWADDPAASKERAVALARRALEVAPNDPAALANAAHTLAIFGEDITAMIALVERSLALNPSYARGWYVSGFLRIIAGDPDTAIEHTEKSLRLSPRDYLGVPHVIIAGAHFLAGRFQLAIENYSLVMRQVPAFPWTYRYLAACYAYLGRLGEARAVIEQLRSTGAAVMPDTMRGPMLNAKLRELLLSGLRLAIGETT